jgi:hypothetical protein
MLRRVNPFFLTYYQVDAQTPIVLLRSWSVWEIHFGKISMSQVISA